MFGNRAKRHNRVMYIDRNEDGSPVENEPEPLECDSCGKRALSLERCHWDERLMVGSCCANEIPDEPLLEWEYAMFRSAQTVEQIREISRLFAERQRAVWKRAA